MMLPILTGAVLPLEPAHNRLPIRMYIISCANDGYGTRPN